MTLSKMLESLNLCLLTMEMCLTAEATELLRGSEEGTDAKSTLGDGKGCIKDVFWNQGLQRLPVGPRWVQVRGEDTDISFSSSVSIGGGAGLGV